MGRAAYRFCDFLADAGQKIWQVLPLGPTGFGDSPYKCFSAFAGNPLLVDLEEPAAGEAFPEERVDYGKLIPVKTAALRRAFEGFAPGPEFDEFRARHREWLEDYALFMALKRAHSGEAVWTEWPEDIRRREPGAMARWRAALAREIRFEEFTQYLFFRQWHALREDSNERGIRIMGDVPIYVAHDSADVWAHPEFFQLDEGGRPAAVAGVPPDYFSATGQLWGNPIYRWDVMERDGFAWWVSRLRGSFELFDIIRLDHFRGFEAYWEVPAGEATAMHGRWVKGPGARLFEAIERELGELPIVAENLGVITPEVEAIRERFGFPGMSILQFAFGADPQAADFRPHNYPRQRVAYTGTHDNDTTLGWWTSQGAGDTTRTAQDVAQERAFALSYLATDGRGINWVFIRTLMASVAEMVLFPLQDVLGLGSEARMNIPSRPGGNWRWRYREGALTPELAARLRQLATIYDR